MLKHKIAVGLLLGVSFGLLGGGTQLTPTIQAKSTAKITQLRARYAGLQHQVYDQNDSYSRTPRFRANFYQGQLTNDYTNSTTNWLNYYRQLSGLPPLTNDQAHNREAQIAAADMAAVNRLSHGLVGLNKPNYISAHDWAIGQKVTKISNLGEMYQKQSIEKTVGSYVLDNFNIDGNNTAHRAWVLSPNVTRYSVGMAYHPGAQFAFSNFYWVDGLSKRVVPHRKAVVLYPGAGAFPKNLVTTSNTQHPIFWSAYFTHKVHFKRHVTITVRDNQTRKTVRATNVNVDRHDYYGDFYATISYLPGKLPLKAKHTYRVTIKGITKYPRGYRYSVKLY